MTHPHVAYVRSLSEEGLLAFIQANSQGKADPDAMLRFAQQNAVDLARLNAAGVQTWKEGGARSAEPGLVSVQTTQTRQRVCPQVHRGDAIERVGLVERARADDGWVIDSQGLRLAKLRMHVGFAARAHAVSEKRAHREQAVMVTLTYRGDNTQWKPTHLTEATNRFRIWCRRRGIGCRYVWVAELQERGVIHYHLIAWLPLHERMPMWDRRGWWPHGMTRTERARNAVPYLLKYLSKDASKSFGSFPRGARLYGVGGLDPALRRARAWLNRPSFVQGNSSIDDPWKRAKGGGWQDPQGNVWKSEFELTRIGEARGVRRVRTHARSIEAAGPFSWFDQPMRDAAARALVH